MKTIQIIGALMGIASTIAYFITKDDTLFITGIILIWGFIYSQK